MAGPSCCASRQGHRHGHGAARVADRLRGLRAGADVYLVKPVELDELLAVVHNLVNRISRNQETPPQGWRLDTLGWSLTSPNGSLTKLTYSETLLLNVLATQLGQTVSKETLILESSVDRFQ